MPSVGDMEVEATAEKIVATDETATGVAVEIEGWEPADDGTTLERATDGAVVGRTRRIIFPSRFGRVTELSGGRSHSLDGVDQAISLSGGEYVLRVEAELKCFLQFAGDAAIHRQKGNGIVVEFPKPTSVAVGFRSRRERPAERITIPRTPEGVAAAITGFSVAIEVVSPDRSFPGYRDHPPLVELGESIDIPGSIRRRRPETDVSIELPANLEYLFPAASLAQYLGARVKTGADRPRIVAGDRTVWLDRGAGYRTEVNELLRRTFLLDCLARSGGPHQDGLGNAPSLSEIGLSTEAVYEAPIAERFRRYVDAPFERIDDRLPEWHLCMYVDPTYDCAETLSYLVNDLAAIYPPETEPLQENERLSRSLDDHYSGSETGDGTDQAGGIPRAIADAPTVDLTKPQLREGTAHGWLAEGTPINVFKSTPAAYGNRSRYYGRSEESISVVAVLNDRAMSEEHAEVADIYRQRARDLELDIAIREHLTTDELAAAFGTGHDLLHFVGHCEDGGLRCPDGTLAATDLDESNVQTFFLNACGSYYEGMDLIRKGSVAGAITFNTVLDAQAAKVGTMFARLVAHGYSIERALGLASRRVLVNKDYGVVGDGTYVLTQTENVIGPEGRLERIGDDRFRLNYSVWTPQMPGGSFGVAFDHEERDIFGGEITLERTTEEVRAFLSESGCPVIYRGDIHWGPELAKEL